MRASDDRKGTPGITELSRARVPIDPAVCYLNLWGMVAVMFTKALANIGETSAAKLEATPREVEFFHPVETDAREGR